MRVNRKKPDPPHFLSGWKEIANYLGKGVRTVQRYEWQMGLPVRRPAGKPRGSVVATKPELDAWVSASPIRNAFLMTGSANNSPASAAEVKEGIMEMRKLREQMKALHREVRTSLHLLTEGVSSLRSELKRNHSAIESPAFGILEEESRSKPMFELLGLNTGQRKVS